MKVKYVKEKIKTENAELDFLLNYISSKRSFACLLYPKEINICGNHNSNYKFKILYNESDIIKIFYQCNLPFVIYGEGHNYIFLNGQLEYFYSFNVDYDFSSVFENINNDTINLLNFITKVF